MPPDPQKPSLRDLKTYGHSRAVRLADCHYCGDERIHLTICAATGQPFRQTEIAQLVTTNVEFYAAKFHFQLYGYCLMPDHLHVLLSPANSGKGASDWLQAFKSYTAHMYVKQGGRPPLWQRSAYDHVCRKEETAEKVLIYLINNPVRAGLVKCWMDWPWTKVFIEM